VENSKNKAKTAKKNDRACPHNIKIPPQTYVLLTSIGSFKAPRSGFFKLPHADVSPRTKKRLKTAFENEAKSAEAV
jgi:hypothetical protein